MIAPLRWALVLIACAALVSGGCGTASTDAGNGKRDPAPTAATLRKMRAASYPVYWLGYSFRGKKLTSLAVDLLAASAEYGPPSCDSGCSYPISIVSRSLSLEVFPSANDEPATWGPVCFERMRDAMLMGCPGEGEYDLLTGGSDIGIEISGDQPSARAIVASLTPLNRVSSHRLPPPDRLSCQDLAGFPRWFRTKLPRSLAPQSCP